MSLWRGAYHFLRADRPGRAGWLCAVERRAGVSLVFPTTPMVAPPQYMVDGRTNFVLLAILFFIFAGAIMEQAALTAASFGGPGGRRPHTRRIAEGHCREHVPCVGYVGL